jgi:hypothetical protein
MVAVTETGCGMHTDLMARAFDPFLRPSGPAKERASESLKCTSFLKQSKGHVKLYSEQNKRSAVKLYLSRDLSKTIRSAKAFTLRAQTCARALGVYPQRRA